MAYSSSHPIRTLISFDNFSLPFYSSVNIIRVSFLLFVKNPSKRKGNMKKNIYENRRYQRQPSSTGLWNIITRYHNTHFTLSIFLGVVIRISFLSSPSLSKWKLFFRAHKRQHHINYPIYSADLWRMLCEKGRGWPRKKRKFINRKEKNRFAGCYLHSLILKTVSNCSCTILKLVSGEVFITLLFMALDNSLFFPFAQ